MAAWKRISFEPTIRPGKAGKYGQANRLIFQFNPKGFMGGREVGGETREGGEGTEVCWRLLGGEIAGDRQRQTECV